jgi:deoxyribodipyrimidine photolyase-related protein
MVLGNLAMTYGVHPLRFHEWHVAMYLDSVDWASLPNALGMSQYGDGGIIGTKPYCSTGKYVNRMSDHCRHCRYDPAASVGDDACPLTTFYWDFLARHADRFSDNPRMFMQVRNVERKAAAGELGAIRSRAAELRREWSGNRC